MARLTDEELTEILARDMRNYEMRERAPSSVDIDIELVVVYPKIIGRPKTVLVSAKDKRVIGIQG